MGLEQHRLLAREPSLRCVWRYSEPFLQRVREAGQVAAEPHYVARRPVPADLLQFRSILRRERPDVVYTVFGPSFGPSRRRPHLCGFGNGWLLEPNDQALAALDRTQRRRRAIKRAAARLNVPNASHYWIETASAGESLTRVFGVPRDRIRVIPNNCADVFRDWDGAPVRHVRRTPDEFVVVTVAAWYPHKNLATIPEVAAAITGITDRPVRFVVTLPPDGEGWRSLAAAADRLGVADAVQTVGRVPLSELPALYAGSDAMFLPSLLETFSATYPEAMQMEIPIVTTDLDFARSLCGDAALYFTPGSAAAAATEIARLAKDPELAGELVAAGREIVQHLPGTDERVASIVEALHQAAAEGRA